MNKLITFLVVVSVCYCQQVQITSGDFRSWTLILAGETKSVLNLYDTNFVADAGARISADKVLTTLILGYSRALEIKTDDDKINSYHALDNLKEAQNHSHTLASRMMRGREAVLPLVHSIDDMVTIVEGKVNASELNNGEVVNNWTNILGDNMDLILAEYEGHSKDLDDQIDVLKYVINKVLDVSKNLVIKSDSDKTNAKTAVESLTEIKKSLATLATEVAKQAEKLKAYVNSIGESITTIQSKLK